MKYVLILIVILAVLVAGYVGYMRLIVNPNVVHELRDNPNGERAHKVMLIVLPDGKTFPVNYLREGDTVYAAADGAWWRQLRGQGAPVELLVRGETLNGQARAIEGDAEHRSAVFDRLLPNAPKIFGMLVQIELVPSS